MISFSLSSKRKNTIPIFIDVFRREFFGKIFCLRPPLPSQEKRDIFFTFLSLYHEIYTYNINCDVAALVQHW